jgi:hypothetical protein
MKSVLAAPMALLLLGGPAYAQIGAPTDCSGTAGITSAAIVFSHPPGLYVLLNDPSGTATLAVNPNGAAVVGGSGSVGIASNATLLLSAAQGVPPWATINIIASAAATPFSCKFQ